MGLGLGLGFGLNRLTLTWLSWYVACECDGFGLPWRS